MWLQELSNIRKFIKENGLPNEEPNLRNRHGIFLDNFDFREVFRTIIEKVVTPIAKKLWWNIGENSLDEHTAYTTAYSKGWDQSLGQHFDDSEITVNYCLGK